MESLLLKSHIYDTKKSNFYRYLPVKYSNRLICFSYNWYFVTLLIKGYYWKLEIWSDLSISNIGFRSSYITQKKRFRTFSTWGRCYGKSYNHITKFAKGHYTHRIGIYQDILLISGNTRLCKTGQLRIFTHNEIEIVF